jgi:glycerol 2-dehydrogenase (NADP+)
LVACVSPFGLLPSRKPKVDCNALSLLFASADKKGCLVLPKSVNPSRIDANLSGFIGALGKLDDSDVEKLDGVAASGKQKRFTMPPWG